MKQVYLSFHICDNRSAVLSCLLIYYIHILLPFNHIMWTEKEHNMRFWTWRRF